MYKTQCMALECFVRVFLLLHETRCEAQATSQLNQSSHCGCDLEPWHTARTWQRSLQAPGRQKPFHFILGGINLAA